MAGIYIHIPFCNSKCNYCNFYSVASSKHLDAYVPALLKEIALQQPYLEKEPIETIYIGGGTPSLLGYTQLASILEKLNKTFEIKPDAEITIEANPNDLNASKIKEFKNLFINRLSIGIQSFFKEDLKYLHRLHSPSQAETAVKRSQDAGFENISIDLIYGIPTLSDENWKKNLHYSFSLNVPHISAYSLTVEPNTALNKLITKGKLTPVNEEQSIKHFKVLMQQTRENDFLHYEVSNFCKKDYFSKHNSNYWKGIKYLGLGPSAHSYNKVERQWNISDTQKYIEHLDSNKLLYEKEVLSETDKLNEYIMTSLRTMWGCDLNYIETHFGISEKTRLEKKSVQFINEKKMIKENNLLILSDEGFLFADGIAAELFV